MVPPEAIADLPADMPLYAQVAATLRTAIERGAHAPATRLPTEAELCRRFQVSRHTIRDALRQLRAEGLITSSPGSRPVIAARPAASAVQLEATIGADFYDYVLRTRFEIERMEVAPLDDRLAAELALPPGEVWLQVRGWRVDTDDGHPTCWNEYLIAQEHAGIGRLIARHVGPLVPLLEDFTGTRMARLLRSIAAIPMPSAQAPRFASPIGAPALAVVTRCEDAAGRLVLLHRSLHATGTITYAIRR